VVVAIVREWSGGFSGRFGGFMGGFGGLNSDFSMILVVVCLEM
jgi:hypothetical protein